MKEIWFWMSKDLAELGVLVIVILIAIVPSDCEPRCNCMCENHNMYEPISRYDRIVKMTIEEMAQLFCENFDCASCPAYELCRETEEPEWNGFIKFLNMEVDNETDIQM